MADVVEDVDATFVDTGAGIDANMDHRRGAGP
jgi:hypothetical protein